MKKILVSIAVFFAVNCFTGATILAETGREIMQASATAMNFEKLEEFKTSQIRATLYAQGQRVGIRIMSKDDNLRFEQTVMGKEQVFVLTEEAFFKLKPTFEEMHREDAGRVLQMLPQIIPSMLITQVKALDEEKISIEFMGIENFNGKSSKKVKVVPQGATEGQYYYFDAVTNWFLGVDLAPKASLVFEKMKRSKGYVYPTVIKMMNDGKKLYEIEVDRLELDIALDDALFARPF